MFYLNSQVELYSAFRLSAPLCYSNDDTYNNNNNYEDDEDYAFFTVVFTLL